jgi:hypothetical protein
MESPDGYQPGDKVRVRSGPHLGSRGILLGQEGGLVRLELSSGETILVQPHELTNFSLAARKAWQTMPKRAGRPPSPNTRKKMVSLRLDVDVWRMLGRAAEFNLIPSREQAVNEWLRKRLVQLLDSAPNAGLGELSPLRELPDPSFEDSPLKEGSLLHAVKGEDHAQHRRG